VPAGAEPTPALLVSACLLGVACNHRGQGNRSEVVVALSGRYRLIAICPETAGGLPTPRPAAEVQLDGTVRTADGEDVTAAYRSGAATAVALGTAVGARGAVLKARSPSCGYGGVTAGALVDAGIGVRTEEDVADARGGTFVARDA
jgi:uncharacterized protein YbbK (DUF523 family)